MVGLAADDVEAFLQVKLGQPNNICWSTFTFAVCGGEVWYLERNGHPENQVHGADRPRAKRAGDLTSQHMKLFLPSLSCQHVDIAHWAGLGGVRYIPADYIDSETEKVLEMSEEDLRLTNQRNMELVATLRNTDSAFSLGEGPPPLSVMCVRFGMVTMETEVEELLSLVINCGKDIDEAVTQLHTMSEVRYFQRKLIEQFN